MPELRLATWHGSSSRSEAPSSPAGHGRARLDRPVTVVAAHNEATMNTLLPRLFASGCNGANTSSLPDRYTMTSR
jgi:hypothetical protein